MIKGSSIEGVVKVETNGHLATIMSDLVVFNVAVVSNICGDDTKNMDVFEHLMKVLARELTSPVIKDAYTKMQEQAVRE